MPIMTNAEAFEYDFGIYATELWSMTEEQFLTWLNSECDRERPRDMIVRCKDCKHRQELRECPMYHLNYERYEWQLDEACDDYTKDDGFCDRGERKDDDD